MGKPFSPEQRQAWLEKIHCQQKSGKSIEKWCKENHIGAHVFHYWKRRLFPPVLDRSSFTELTDQKACSLQIDYQDVNVQIKAPSLKQCLAVLKALKC